MFSTAKVENVVNDPSNADGEERAEIPHRVLRIRTADGEEPE